jgi:putative PIN family toxin of toxin-antitoxin system
LTRLVLDASVLLSGAVSAAMSPPAVLVDAVTASSFEAVACPRLLSEFERGLRKPYFRSRLNTAQASELLRTLRLLAITFPDPPVLRRVLRDPTDDYLVELAQASKAEAIVTGDRDLLDHDGLRPPAIDARAACELLGLL